MLAHTSQRCLFAVFDANRGLDIFAIHAANMGNIFAVFAACTANIFFIFAACMANISKPLFASNTANIHGTPGTRSGYERIPANLGCLLSLIGSASTTSLHVYFIYTSVHVAACCTKITCITSTHPSTSHVNKHIGAPEKEASGKSKT